MRPHQLNAIPRWRPDWNWCDRTAIWQISITPPAMPWMKRATISTDTLSVSPQISEAMPKAMMPATKMRLRP
ncbi:hypothetical protein D3C72_2379970 [compost metagenome]